MNTTPKDNTPDELDGIDKLFKKFIQYSSGYNEYTIEEEKMLQFEKELRGYIAREIDEVIGKNERSKEVVEFLSIRGLSDKAKKAVVRDGLRVEQRQRAADRGWRIK